MGMGEGKVRQMKLLACVQKRQKCKLVPKTLSM